MIVALVQRLGVDPLDVHIRAEREARVPQRLGHGEIGVVQLDIFADEANLDRALARFDARHHVRPFGQIGRGRVDSQLAADDGGEVRRLQHQRRLIQAGERDIFDDAVRLDVAEHRNFAEDGRLQRLVAAEDDDVRPDAHALQFFDGMLRRLGFVLVGATQKRHQRDMDEEAVLLPNLEGDLPHGLEERLRFDVTDGAANFCDDDVRIGLLADTVDEFLDFVGNVGDDLHGGAEILAAPLLVQHVPVDFAGREVGVFVEVFVDEALIMPEVEVGLRAVFRHVDLAVLIGTHRAGVDVDVGVELLRGDLQPPHLQQPAKRRRRDALSKAGDHAAGHKNVFRHVHTLVFLYRL